MTEFIKDAETGYKSNYGADSDGTRWVTVSLANETIASAEKERDRLAAQLAVSEAMYQSGCQFEDQCKSLAAQNAELIEVLKELDNRYCTVQPDMTKDERLEHRRTLIKVRTLLAKAEAV